MKTTRFELLKRSGWACGAIVVLYALMLIPGQERHLAAPATRRPFVWNQDQFWNSLESSYVAMRGIGCARLDTGIQRGLLTLGMLTSGLRDAPHRSDDPLYASIEQSIFSLAPMIGACPSYLPQYIESLRTMRTLVKEQSLSWDMTDIRNRDRLYRLLYGSRQAMEEVMLQAPPEMIPATIVCDDEQSQCPVTYILGISVHSGDILVSRGAVAASALIARGNDYPGNFSHVALVHVDTAGQALLIESHIERGVTASTLEEYLRDTKLRIMVLRLRSDLPPLQRDPQLPARAAASALQDARSRHIPYDFSMDFADTSKYFCSEVVSTAYRRFGVTLWRGMSSISTPGVSRWLATFGVEHFETEEPSDLEYDPQLRVVAEWRDPAVLFNDHVDNAAIDAMLEDAERGERLRYAWYLLPIARAVKLYSLLLNASGKVGPVPEGMSPEGALCSHALDSGHDDVKTMVLARAAEFRKERGYAPPYWELLNIARASKAALDSHTTASNHSQSPSGG